MARELTKPIPPQQLFLQGVERFFRQKNAKTASLYCTFTALLYKSLLINGAGEGNRTLVSMAIGTKLHPN